MDKQLKQKRHYTKRRKHTRAPILSYTHFIFHWMTTWFTRARSVFPHLSHKIPGIRLVTDIRVRYFLIGALLVTLVSGYVQTAATIEALPDPKYLTSRDIAVTTKIYDRNSQLLYEIYRDTNRTPIPLSDIPKIVQQATIATEDKAFYTHPGISIVGIMRAALHNAQSTNREGGSTITQQLIRSSYLTQEKTIVRKVKEIVLSIWAERYYSKNQILEMYLNQVPYGGTAWGIEAAAQTYFGKPTKGLSLAQAAYLAGLPAAPGAYSPYSNDPKLAIQRQHHVLSRMQADGFITETQAKEAKAETIRIQPAQTNIAAPHFVMYVKDQLDRAFGQEFVASRGLRVKTTLDLTLQTQLQQLVARHIDDLQGLSVGNGALVVTHPKTGEILAMVGSRDYFDSDRDGNVNVTTSLRQPGSSIKVVTYAAALQKGFTAASLLHDAPVTFNIPDQEPYRPVNYDGKYHGQVPMRTALGSSYNIPAVNVLKSIGLQTVLNQGRQMGITSWRDSSRYGLSLTLGGGEVTMLEMATVYGALANGGIHRDVTPFLSISDYRRQTLPIPGNHTNNQTLPPGVAFILSSILSDNQARMPAFGPSSSLVIPGKTVAVKTGTTDNKRDNWTIGYTPEYVVTVWVGNNDNTPMNPQLTSGVTGAAPIWHDAMELILKDRGDKPFQQPDDVVAIPCYGRTEYFLKGTEPKQGCAPYSNASPSPKP